MLASGPARAAMLWRGARSRHGRACASSSPPDNGVDSCRRATTTGPPGRIHLEQPLARSPVIAAAAGDDKRGTLQVAVTARPRARARVPSRTSSWPAPPRPLTLESHSSRWGQSDCGRRRCAQKTTHAINHVRGAGVQTNRCSALARPPPQTLPFGQLPPFTSFVATTSTIGKILTHETSLPKSPTTEERRR
ncbi:hypothetical protein MRX96_014625 [Rhipicephalus microplus]